jgi:hypothetical protein
MKALTGIPRRHHRVSHTTACLQVVLPSPVPLFVQRCVPELAYEVMLEHPEHLIADRAIVVPVNVCREGHRNHIQVGVRLVFGRREEGVALILTLGRLRHAAKPRHIWLPRQRLNHADDSPDSAFRHPTPVFPDEIMRAAVGDDDDRSVVGSTRGGVALIH